MKAKIFDPENRKWWTLGAVAFGLFMIMLDNTIVNVALPSIQSDLNIGISELEWVFNGYALTFGVLMLTGGKLADLLGRRRIFIVGLVVFTVASLFCGLATSAGWLIGARVVQGAGLRAHEPRDPVDHHGHLPAAAARHGDRDLGRRLGDGARDRAPRRRAHHRALELELDLLHQRPDRDPGDHRHPARRGRVPRHLGRAAARPPRASDLGDRSLRAHLRPDRGEHLRLDVAAHPRALRRGRDRASPRSSCSRCTSARRCSTSACSRTAPSRARTA